MMSNRTTGVGTESSRSSEVTILDPGAATFASGLVLVAVVVALSACSVEDAEVAVVIPVAIDEDGAAVTPVVVPAIAPRGGGGGDDDDTEGTVPAVEFIVTVVGSYIYPSREREKLLITSRFHKPFVRLATFSQRQRRSCYGLDRAEDRQTLPMKGAFSRRSALPIRNQPRVSRPRLLLVKLVYSGVLDLD